ncbi:hypothetical protein HPP92_008556 [Vanilla planifolia]|uniref:Uncharacterized protein n=1 Tax=Vanilla planifolia TaxID=51239 RepID=A0A835V805_VANPL|nr:hypothetical protein HPP92_008556 [Vanilla planifolia]
MQEVQPSIMKYTIFWVILLSSKLFFSYHFQIKPLIEPTKHIMKISINNYDWHEFFPEVQNNAGAILAVWAPIILVYFMDAQIWYSIFCTIFGGVYGIVHHLGEIRTIGMVRSRFYSFPSMFNVSLVPHSAQRKINSIFKDMQNKFFKNSDISRDELAKFALVWNQIIISFRSEDLISNRERDLMIMPLSSELRGTSARWPLFLLASKFSIAVNVARDYVGNFENLYRKIKKDKYMFYAVKECYDTLKNILNFLVIGYLEKRFIRAIFDEIDASIGNSNIMNDFKLNELPVLLEKITKMTEILFDNKQARQDALIISIQDVLEFFVKDVMAKGGRILDIVDSHIQESGKDSFFMQHEVYMLKSGSQGLLGISLLPDKGRRISFLRFPLPDKGPLKDQVKRLYLMLTVKEAAMDIPSNLEARRRISFFATSLFMRMPPTPEVRNMLSFCIMTPYFMEEVKFSEDELHSNQDGSASILYYMRKIYPDEWKNFLERMNHNITDEDTRYWASFRGQTLSRTVRGMMYYRKALKLQAFLDLANNQDIMKGCPNIETNHGKRNSQLSLAAKLDALVDMKFTYVISCQMFGAQKASGDSHAQDIIDLMSRYPSLRIAYIEEKEEIVADKTHKVYSSILIKAVNKLDQEIYRIKLPGPPIIGEGKPENQNHAIIFTRGEALQAIDMNQDNYFEEAYKMRNLLQEFLKHSGQHQPTILGLREHIFTGSISSLAGFMSYQESSFVTIGQRFLANPLRVRFHYGHPDIFDRIFHITQGGISKASKTINLSEDIFAGFNTILRRGHISVFGVYVFLYGQLYLVLSGVERALIVDARMQNIKSLETALASQSFLQLGLLSGLPMVMELGLEKGFRSAMSDFILMQLQLASVFLRSPWDKGSLLWTDYPTWRSYESSIAYIMITYSAWFMAIAWLFAPFLFNPSGFTWRKIVEDWDDWNKWMKNVGGIGVQPEKSWESWWNAEYAHLRHSGLWSRILEIFFSFVSSSTNMLVTEGRRLLSINFHLTFRFLKLLIFLAVVAGIITLLSVCRLSLMDLVVCCLAFLPTGWGLLSIAQTLRPKMEQYWLWEPVRVIAQAYDYGMGNLLFAPIAVLAWMPLVSAIQTRVLFNQAFTRQLRIHTILYGKGKNS